MQYVYLLMVQARLQTFQALTPRVAPQRDTLLCGNYGVDLYYEI
jgi:hypothetical protein